MTAPPAYKNHSCCICASRIDSPSASGGEKDEKSEEPPNALDLPCCSRIICGNCLQNKPQYQTYCPYCQISTVEGTSSLPRGGLRDPPAYSKTSANEDQGPPPYSSRSGHHQGEDDKSEAAQQREIIHFLRPDETIASLSLAYRVPQAALRKHNQIWSDSLLHAHKTILIPPDLYHGESLSPTPVEEPEETERKSNIRRFMMTAKCHQYEVAELYMKNSGGDLDMALEAWRGDEQWEMDNPLKGKKKKFATSLTSQISR